jgi:hypothetical protein
MGMLPRNFRTDGFVDPCAPIRAANPPVGLGWVHEIKHDGYRLIVRQPANSAATSGSIGFLDVPRLSAQLLHSTNARRHVGAVTASILKELGVVRAGLREANLDAIGVGR